MTNKLELKWYGKDNPIQIEPRLLIEDRELSNYENDPGTENMLIHGDNLLALKALENKYAGQVKCIYIDPPYNTGAAFKYYDDNIEHSTWLNLMKPRLEIMKKLLSDDGIIFVQIDDNELAYLTILMDEIFKRNNRINIISVKMSEASGIKMTHVNKRLTKIKESILVYKKDKTIINPVKIQKNEWDYEYNKVFKELTISEKRDLDRIVNNRKNGIHNDSDLKIIDKIFKSKTIDSFRNVMKNEGIDLTTENEQKWLKENSFRVFRTATSNSVKKLVDDKKEQCSQTVFSVESNRDKKIYLVKSDYSDKSNSPRVHILFAEDYLTQYIGDLWLDIGTTGLEFEGGIDFKNSKKPERLIERIITLATKPGDLVLDSFLGSGTTVAVAHKMGRKYIGIEMGNHAYTHCKVRIDKIISGIDMSGISEKVNWKSGGGYRFYELAPTLINKDIFGEYVINKEYDANMLASAVSLHEGFVYQPDSNLFWKQSIGNENSFLFVTTRHLDSMYLDSIKDTMEEDEYLVVACRSFDKEIENTYPNIAIRKIPQMLLEHCEFDKTDYNLNIVTPPVYNYEEEDDHDGLHE